MQLLDGRSNDVCFLAIKALFRPTIRMIVAFWSNVSSLGDRALGIVKDLGMCLNRCQFMTCWFSMSRSSKMRVYVCTYACRSACMYTRMNVWRYVCVHVYMCVCTYTDAHTYTDVYMHPAPYRHPCIHIRHSHICTPQYTC